MLYGMPLEYNMCCKCILLHIHYYYQAAAPLQRWDEWEALKIPVYNLANEIWNYYMLLLSEPLKRKIEFRSSVDRWSIALHWSCYLRHRQDHESISGGRVRSAPNYIWLVSAKTSPLATSIRPCHNLIFTFSLFRLIFSHHIGRPMWPYDRNILLALAEDSHRTDDTKWKLITNWHGPVASNWPTWCVFHHVSVQGCCIRFGYVFFFWFASLGRMGWLKMHANWFYRTRNLRVTRYEICMLY